MSPRPSLGEKCSLRQCQIGLELPHPAEQAQTLQTIRVHRYGQIVGFKVCPVQANTLPTRGRVEGRSVRLTVPPRIRCLDMSVVVFIITVDQQFDAAEARGIKMAGLPEPAGSESVPQPGRPCPRGRPGCAERPWARRNRIAVTLCYRDRAMSFRLRHILIRTSLLAALVSALLLSVDAPARPAASAAINPAGPAPATSMSQCALRCS